MKCNLFFIGLEGAQLRENRANAKIEAVNHMMGRKNSHEIYYPHLDDT